MPQTAEVWRVFVSFEVIRRMIDKPFCNFNIFLISNIIMHTILSGQVNIKSLGIAIPFFLFHAYSSSWNSTKTSLYEVCETRIDHNHWPYSHYDHNLQMSSEYWFVSHMYIAGLFLTVKLYWFILHDVDSMAISIYQLVPHDSREIYISQVL